MINKPLVNVIIPTFDNSEYLRPCLESLLKYHTPNLFDVTIINNGGNPHSCDFIPKNHKLIKVVNLIKNTGWEGGVMSGLANTDSDLVIFMNDDVLIPDTSIMWIHRLVQYFKNPIVAAVGPSSNCVMGLQNIFAFTPEVILDVRYLIGFCVMVRRKAFEQIGGMDFNLSGGDDLDWSIRLRDAGYKLLIDRATFIYHHGFKTGTRTMGDAQTVGGWNSYEMTEKTNMNLIKKHGLKKWFETLYKQNIEGNRYTIADTEGNLIRKLVQKDKNILDIGCGANKTLSRAKGIDMIPKGHRIPSLYGDAISQADLEADVSINLPVEDKSQDVIIARHILEHMIDPITALEGWIDKLRDGGRIIIAVPNHEIVNSIPMNLEHIHGYIPQSLGVLLTSMGLKDIKSYDPCNNISFVMEATK